MTRRDFRAFVDGPRPAAAWLMSLVATATLWITEQIPAWIIAVQIAAFGVSFLRRRDPAAFQRSPIWLNIFMIGITTITIRAALNGNPATISLAYFTALAQGLQLLDARPRKSEFVLVALALFQVILASNLTDSVLFPPLLLIFLITVTWTLLVHTLSMEAAEAGDPAAASTVMTPDLRRMTVKATGICLVLAVALFVSIPRLKTNVFRGGVGTGMGLSGFSNRVSLGDVGKIRMDHSVVLRVEGIGGALPSPSKAYWRGLAFDEFDGRNWAISKSERVAARQPISGVGRFGIDLLPPSGEMRVAQRIIREPIEAGVLFVPGEVQRIEGSFQRLERDRNGGLYLPGRGDERLRYTIWSQPEVRDPDILRADRALPPMESNPGGERPAERYLRLPELDPRVHLLASEIVAGAANDFDRARKIEQKLQRDGRYTDEPPPLGDDAVSPIEAFVLGELEGHCEYFASAMVALARTQGLPSRLVNGFAGGVRNELGGFVEVTQADAHAWVEIHFEDSGWVRFDPTPVDLRLRSDADGSLWAKLGQIGGAIELWWFQRVVDFDSVDQIGTLRGIWLSWTANRSAKSAGDAEGTRSTDSTWSNPIDGLDRRFLVVPILLALGLLFHRLRAHAADQSAVPKSYRAALRILSRKGLVRGESDAALDFAQTVASRIPRSGALAFQEITERYLEERFGRRGCGALEAELASLENAVHGMRLRNQTDVG